MLWINDPVTKQPSVSLTIMVVAGLGVLVSNILLVMGKISTAGNFLEMFYSAQALYFGRRLSVGGKLFSADAAEKIQEKVSGKNEKEAH